MFLFPIIISLVISIIKFVFPFTGKIIRIVFSNVKGRNPLPGNKMKDFRTLVNAKADDIVRRWVEYFVFKKQNKPEIITRKIK